MKTLKNIVYLFLILSLTGCLKDVDTDQLDDAEIETSFLITLVHFDVEAPDLLNEFNEEIPVHFDLIQTNVDDSGRKYLNKIELTTVASNNFSRAFTVRVILYNANQEPIYTLTPDVVIPPFSENLETTIEIPKEDLTKVYDAQYFGFFFTIEPSDDGSFIDPNDGSTFNFQSSMELFFNFKQV